jgi:4,5-dihydroxyphthalate decarboxylase
MQEIYGIFQDRVNWTTTATERLKIPWPKNVTVQQTTVAEGPTELLESGQVDCIMMPKIGRASPDWAIPQDDLEQAQIDYYAASGVFPIMHLVVVSERLLSKHPTLASRIMDGLRQAKSLASLENPIPSLNAEHSRALFGDDPWPIGIEPNRKSIETFLRHALDQELIVRPVAVEELFVAGLSV